jgi:hypothetical protein
MGLFLMLSAETSWAEYRLGGYVGFGGAGIKTVSTVGSSDVNVERSDGPGILGLSIEYLTSDTASIAVDHTRGVFLSPFSSGVGFTGVTWRWFLSGKAPSVVPSQNNGSTVLVTRRIPFLGLATGIASGIISRENDLVPAVSAAGVYVGFHGGYDCQTVPGRFIRTEVLYAMTPTSSGFVKSSLSQFALQIGMIFIY